MNSTALSDESSLYLNYRIKFLHTFIDILKKHNPVSKLTGFTSMVVYGLVETCMWTLESTAEDIVCLPEDAECLPEDAECCYFTPETIEYLHFFTGKTYVFVNVVADKEHCYVIFDEKKKYNHYAVSSISLDEIVSFQIDEVTTAEYKDSLIERFLPTLNTVLDLLADLVIEFKKAKCPFPQIDTKEVCEYCPPQITSDSKRMRKIFPGNMSTLIDRSRGLNLNNKSKIFGAIMVYLINYKAAANKMNRGWPVPENYGGERVEIELNRSTFILSLIETENYVFLTIRYRICIFNKKEILKFICAKRIPKTLFVSLEPTTKVVDATALGMIQQWIERIYKYIFRVEISELSRKRSLCSSVSSCASDGERSEK